MTRLAIEARDLTYSYGDRLAVDRVSFDVPEGTILGFLGPNGAGKTTTIRLLTGQTRPMGGTALVLGLDVGRHPKQVQAQIGVCFERTNLYEQMSARENLKLFASLFGVRDLNPEALLERVGLNGRERDRVESYSKGMKQRLMLARALVGKPRLLFLDEPTEGLDPVSAESIRRLILEERAAGTTVFLTTHDMLEADRLSDRVAFLHKGRIVALDTPHNLKQSYGKRALRAQVAGAGEALVEREIVLDRPETMQAVQELFARERVVTLHSEEASLEDIFIRITGEGLT